MSIGLVAVGKRNSSAEVDMHRPVVVAGSIPREVAALHTEQELGTCTPMEALERKCMTI